MYYVLWHDLPRHKISLACFRRTEFKAGRVSFRADRARFSSVRPSLGPGLGPIWSDLGFI